MPCHMRHLHRRVEHRLRQLLVGERALPAQRLMRRPVPRQRHVRRDSGRWPCVACEASCLACSGAGSTDCVSAWTGTPCLMRARASPRARCKWRRAKVRLHSCRRVAVARLLTACLPGGTLDGRWHMQHVPRGPVRRHRRKHMRLVPRELQDGSERLEWVRRAITDSSNLRCRLVHCRLSSWHLLRLEPSM